MIENTYFWQAQNITTPMINRIYFQTVYFYTLVLLMFFDVVYKYFNPEENWTHWFWALVGSGSILALRPPSSLRLILIAGCLGYIFSIVLTPFVLPLANFYVRKLTDAENVLQLSADTAYFVLGFVGYKLAEGFARLIEWIAERPARLWEWYMKFKKFQDTQEK